MDKPNFELGQLQRHWIQTLKTYPERQLRNSLGYIDQHGMRLCCLGQLHLLSKSTACLVQLSGARKYIYSGKYSQNLFDSFLDYGLYSADGSFRNPNNPKEGIAINYKGKEYFSLAVLNDCPDITWLDVALVIETYPHLIFSKAV